MDGWGEFQKDLYRGKGKKGRHPQAFPVAHFMLRQGAGPLGSLCWGGISATKIFRLPTEKCSSLTTSPIYLIMLPFYHSIEWEFHIFIKRSSKYISKYLQNMYRNIQVCILKIPSKYMSEDLQNVHQINPQNTSRDDWKHIFSTNLLKHLENSSQNLQKSFQQNLIFVIFKLPYFSHDLSLPSKKSAPPEAITFHTSVCWRILETRNPFKTSVSWCILETPNILKIWKRRRWLGLAVAENTPTARFLTKMGKMQSQTGVGCAE